MGDTLWIGVRRLMVPVPGWVWRRQLATLAAKTAAGLRYFSKDHLRVRRFGVEELPRYGRPLPPARIAEHLGLAEKRVETILAQLEKRLLFLFRNEEGAVIWAYPGTVEETPHKVAFDSGEIGYVA